MRPMVSAAPRRALPAMLLILGLASVAAGETAPAVSLVVEEGLAASLGAEIGRWTDDLKREGYRVLERVVDAGIQAPELRAILASDYRAEGIEGALLVGRLPLAWYENETTGAFPFPADYYYEELDGAWLDADGDGWFDGHSDANHDPEIYLGRLKADNVGSSETALLKAYFDRNHAYRTGKDLPPQRAARLFASDHPAGYRTEVFYGPGSDLRRINLSGDAYRAALRDDSGETALVVAHSWETGHSFAQPNPSVSSWAVREIPKGFRFWLLYNCGVGDLSENANLASMYLLEKTQALGVFAVTKAASTYAFNVYFHSDYMNRPWSLGRALLEFKRIWASDDLKDSDEGEFYLLGDPTLRLSKFFRKDYAPYEERRAEKGWHVFDDSYSYSYEDFLKLGAYYDLCWFKLDDSKGGQGGWGRAANRSFGDLNGDLHVSKGSKAAMEFRFWGDAAEFYSETSSDHGSFEVFVDGESAGQVSLNAPRKGQVKLWEHSWPRNGNHVLRLVAAEPHKWSVVDFFRAHVK